MSEMIPLNTNLSDDESAVIDENDIIIKRTQDVRMAIVNVLVKDGPVPIEKADRELLMKALDGASKTALTSKRIKSDEKSAASNEALAAAIASGATAVMANMPVLPAGGRRLEVIDVDMKIVPGHTFIGTQSVNTQAILADDSILTGE